MESNRIEYLLGRYEEGETTLAEEKELREYFSQKEIPEHLEAYALLFKFQAHESKAVYTEDKVLKLESKNYRFAWTSIAAVIIVALGIFYFNQSQPSLTTSEMSAVNDQEQALEKTKQTLKMVSAMMNEGTADLVYLQEFNKTKNQIIELN
ncbi:hypothetical protein [Christiangramia portivictoriae]|uniref:hypothetical protein n=1 Tax=Christiangramia portivictoriae TaxID=326069 RepID=UPI0003FFACFA|nr:hypothetical protein [Christiangramia portivictoriae]